jgi:ectoine hydroxylase-related dioxygenase (phytanoyl-CoA dioxygenase family)
MPSLQYLPATTPTADILACLASDGALVLKDVLDAATLSRLEQELGPYIAATPTGRSTFAGHHTTRTGALVARSTAIRELLLHPSILPAARAFLAPFCQTIQVHLTQVLRINPGQQAQYLHRDRWAWGTYLQGIEPQFNTIWALTDFTADNGATVVAPGSLGWPDDRQAQPSELTQATMPAGSVLVYSGSVFHGGGANRSAADRIGLNLTYSLGWLRQEENQYLSCPPDIARSLPAELRELLGYRMADQALGYFTPPWPAGTGPECVSPAWAVGGEDAGSLLTGDAPAG